MSWVSLELQDDDSQPIVPPVQPQSKKNKKVDPPSRAGSIEPLDDYAGFPEDAIIRKGRDSQQKDVRKAQKSSKHFLGVLSNLNFSRKLSR
jgi:hypothetical protein